MPVAHLCGQQPSSIDQFRNCTASRPSSKSSSLPLLRQTGNNSRNRSQQNPHSTLHGHHVSYTRCSPDVSPNGSHDAAGAGKFFNCILLLSSPKRVCRLRQRLNHCVFRRRRNKLVRTAIELQHPLRGLQAPDEASDPRSLSADLSICQQPTLCRNV